MVLSVVSVSVPGMANTRLVGPDLPSGLRFPDRSVSLPSEPPLPPMVDPRKAAAATGGAIWFYGGYGNPPQKQIGPNSWGAAESEYQKLADAVQKTAAEVGEAVDSANPEEVLDWLGDEPVWVELTPEGTVVPVPEPDPADWVPGEVPEVVPEVVRPAVGGPTLLGMQGLTADEAFQQHRATSGVGAVAGAGAMGGMNAMAGIGQEDLPLGDVSGRRLTPAQIAAGKAGVKTAKGILEGTVEPPPEPDVVTPPVPPEQETLFMEGLNPEARSMDSQMLTDLMAQQATQPEPGYFGGLGEAVQGLTNRVAGMSGMERAALISALIAAGLITVGSGGMLAPAGAALAGGAGMAALSQ